MVRVIFEGLTADDIVSLPDSDLDALVLNDDAVTFRAGTSEILGRFSVTGSCLILELAQIDGGGEGVLPALGALAKRLAIKRGLSEIDWRVHATNCAQPNLKLRRLLEKRHFEVEDVPEVGNVYRKVVVVAGA